MYTNTQRTDCIQIISIIVILADDELDHQRDELNLFAAQHLLGLIVVIVLLLLDQTVHIVKGVPDFLLEVGPNCLDLVPHSVLLANTRNSRYIEVLRSQFFFLFQDHFFRLLSFNTSLHVPQQESVTLLL